MFPLSAVVGSGRQRLFRNARSGKIFGARVSGIFATPKNNPPAQKIFLGQEYLIVGSMAQFIRLVRLGGLLASGRYARRAYRAGAH
jgi:hypothetical protein